MIQITQATAPKTEMPPWQQNPHAIQKRFSAQVVAGVAAKLRQNSSQLYLLDGSASWMDEYHVYIYFDVQDTLAEIRYAVMGQLNNEHLSIRRVEKI